MSEDPDCLVREDQESGFETDVTRDGGWWRAHIPELGGRTQARYPREVELMAREHAHPITGVLEQRACVRRNRRAQHIVVRQLGRIELAIGSRSRGFR